MLTLFATSVTINDVSFGVWCLLFVVCVATDPEWLKGPEYLPPKLKNLLLLNQLLAHQPWLVKSMINIGDLVQSGAENWSLNELVRTLADAFKMPF